MDRNKAKELSDILLAYSQGKLIQVSNNGNQWVEWIATNPDSIFNYNYYRIKSQPKLVPFTFEDNLLFKDKWFKYKDGAFDRSLKLVAYERDCITVHNQSFNYQKFLDNYIFEDGSPCGKYINE